MWYTLALIIVSAGLIIGMKGCLPGANVMGNFTPNDSLFYPADSSFGNASRADVERRLKALADSPVPAELNPGAMCYEMSMPPDRIEYICPTCGQKTIYTNSAYYDNIENVNSCRYIVTNIKNLTLRLEEKNYCHHCYPDTNAALSLNLYLKYKGEEKEEVIENVSKENLELIWAFMSGQTKVSSFNDDETPLKDYIDQICKLMKVEKPKP
jgi:hypothetical protein